MRAALTVGNIRPSFTFFPNNANQWSGSRATKPDGGMRCSRPVRMEHGMFHMVAVASMPNLVINVTEEALWQHLVATTTTPIKREWMPWIAKGLKAMKKIILPEIMHGCNLGICSATDEDLDSLIVAAVRAKKVSIR
jgi:hypothetical protein